MSLRGRRHGGGRKNELVFYTTAGPATTFDPKITGVAGTWYFPDGTTLTAASGVEISKTFAAEGLHRAVFRAVGSLAAITQIDANTDLLTLVRGIEKIPALTYLSFSVNAGLVISLSSIPPTTTLYARDCNHLFGSLAQLKNGCQTAHLYRSPLILPGSISHVTTIQDLQVYTQGWLTAGVDTVIDSMWTARANYTYATGPSLQIGGTNQAPTGNVTAPIEGADWHQDGATWIPRTVGAKIYDLVNNVNSESRPAWAITYTA